MEVRFRTRKLEEMYLDHSVAVRELGTELAIKYVQRIDALLIAEDLRPLRSSPMFRCHPLKGNRTGQWAIRLNRFYRLIFEILESKPVIVRIEEVSKHYGD